MSFRRRLILFFFLIVVLPIAAVTALVVNITEDARSGKADERLAAGIEAASVRYEEDAAAANRAAAAVAGDPALGDALRAGDSGRAASAARTLAGTRGIESLVVLSADGEELAAVGAAEPVAAADFLLTDRDSGDELGSLTVSTTTANGFLREVRRLTGDDGALYGAGDQLAATAALAPDEEIPSSGESSGIDIGGEEMRVVTGDLPGSGNLSLALVGPVEAGGFLSSSPAVAAGLAAFFAVALMLVALITRALSGQVSTMLEAARRIGSGDFSRRVPVVGGDEMAGLADEFNKMSDQLAAQMDQLRRQQVEIDRSIRRIGEAFASGLDRQALLQILAETAVSACEAEYGLIALTGREGAEAAAGQASEMLQEVVLAAEAQATRQVELIEETREGAFAISAPMRRISEPDHSLGVMTVARTQGPFEPAERDVFLYLIGQAQASIENVALHELVSEQAVTDELTGLSNTRAFLDVAHKEAARAERFQHPLSLVMLDIDNFKKVNDTYGHLQGNEVLKRIGRILQAESRGIDEPARYGGEEFVVALPETDPQGALELAERIRVGIESEEIPFVERSGVLKVTASLGVASIPDSAADVDGLVGAADAALYAAKRAGKNRVVQAAPKAAPPSSARVIDGSPSAGAAAQGKAPTRRS